MARSDDDSALIGGGVSALPGMVALAAIIGSGGVEYVRDLTTAIKQLFGRGGLESALLEEKARAKAYALALAAIADGAITEAEREAIGAAGLKHGIDPDKAIADVSVLIEEVRDPAALRARIVRCASDLDPDDRLELFVVVKNLSHRGSRAWPADAAYRGAAPSPEALVAVFREALGIQITE